MNGKERQLRVPCFISRPYNIQDILQNDNVNATIFSMLDDKSRNNLHSCFLDGETRLDEMEDDISKYHNCLSDEEQEMITNLRNKTVTSAIIHREAASNNFVSVLRYSYEMGNDLDSYNIGYWASMNGNIEVLEYIEKLSYNLEPIYLEISIRRDNEELLTWLLEHGVSWDSQMTYLVIRHESYDILLTILDFRLVDPQDIITRAMSQHKYCIVDFVKEWVNDNYL